MMQQIEDGDSGGTPAKSVTNLAGGGKNGNAVKVD